MASPKGPRGARNGSTRAGLRMPRDEKRLLSVKKPPSRGKVLIRKATYRLQLAEKGKKKADPLNVSSTSGEKAPTPQADIAGSSGRGGPGSEGKRRSPCKRNYKKPTTGKEAERKEKEKTSGEVAIKEGGKTVTTSNTLGRYNKAQKLGKGRILVLRRKERLTSSRVLSREAAKKSTFDYQTNQGTGRGMRETAHLWRAKKKSCHGWRCGDYSNKRKKGVTAPVESEGKGGASVQAAGKKTGITLPSINA